MKNRLSTNLKMKKFLFLTFEFCLLTCCIHAQKDYTQLVNPFIGTGGHGHTYPGATMPFGMMQLSPDTRMADWDGSSGYHYSDSVIYGFSHTHLSGTGIPDYCDILFMPADKFPGWSNKDYRSSFSHKNEKASPGYYEVYLDKYHVKAELSTSLRSGMHQYVFPSATTSGSLIIDLQHRDKVLDAYLEKVNDHELRGYRRSRSWAQNQVVYFYLKFEQPITSIKFNSNDTNGHLQGTDVKAFVTVDLKGNILRCKVGISGVSMDGAKANLDAEIPAWNFNKLKSDAKAAWNKELSKIDIKGGTKDQQSVFYTALYHTMVVPNIYQDVDGQYRGTDEKVHKAEGFTNYTVFSLWDTYRAYHPLMTILNQKRTTDWINTFLHEYKNAGMLPVWELSGNETFCMIGYHSVPVIVDAYQKGIRGFDTKLALEAMRSYAESNRFGLDVYRKQGYISNDKEHESVSKTLEYAYDDWCIAQFAKMTGNDSVYTNYMQRAQSWKNVFDPDTKNMRGKLQGMWQHPFDPKEINNFFTEGNSWQYSFAVPQDIQTLIQMHGGKDSFKLKLDELFTTSSKTTGREQADVTGLIGQYAQGNEPSHHMAYLYNYVGHPNRTQEIVHKICSEFYKNAPDGLIGNEDCGQMSAWYVLSALGFYPVCPGTGEYVIGTPLFDRATIHLENGKKFVISSSGLAKDAYYIVHASLNEKKYEKSYLAYNDIMTGGELIFTLSNIPQKWGTGAANLPHSLINNNLITPVPYFDIEKNRFKDSMLVSIKTVQPGVEIWYSVFRHEYMKPVKYEKPFVIKYSGSILAFAGDFLTGNQRSKNVWQDVFQLRSDRTIRVLSKVNPLYTAGGPEALIDEQFGSTNWALGQWQSYFDTDFEAVIDLQKEQTVNYLAVHVLQDVSPWILYPKEVIFYTSNDGKNFTEAGRVKNEVGTDTKEPVVQQLGINTHIEARYIKIKAINGGNLPTWHESAGNPSHLFIDEVIVK
jgi:predicted alpha-1,2-mannosidase